MNRKTDQQAPARRNKNLYEFCSSFLIWAFHLAIWSWIWMKYYADEIMRPFGYKGNWLVIAVYGILLFLFTSLYGGYRIGSYRKDDIILSCIISLTITNLITYLQTCLIGRGIMFPVPFIIMLVLDILLAWVWATCAGALYFRLFPPHKMLMVYGGIGPAKSLIRKMYSRSEKYSVQEAVSIEVGISAVCEKIDGYQAVILCDVPAKNRNTLLKYCFSHSIRVYTTPKISDILIRGSANINLFDTPLLLTRNQGFTIKQRIIKRCTDVFLSLLGIILSSPFMLLTACAIKIYDRGPVFYRQTRLTFESRQFDVYKFRSMIVDAEKQSGIVLSPENDDRVTPVGRLIRMTRIDELPQLFNILKGDMSFVGPRPERPELSVQYQEMMPEFSYRLKVKAGLTGYAQIFGRYNTTPYDKLKMDLMYIAGFSLIEDLKLIMMTIKIVFVRESTQGILQEEESDTDVTVMPDPKQQK